MPTTETSQRSEGELPSGQPDTSEAQTTPITRYQRLADLATFYSAAAADHEQQCLDEAHNLRAAAKEYFQAPDDSLHLISLNAQLEPLDTEPHQHLKLVQGRDAFWYFGLVLQFGSGRDQQVSLAVGLKFSGDAIVARLRTDTGISPTRPDRWTRILQTLEAGLLEHFQRPASMPRKSLGYTAP